MTLRLRLLLVLVGIVAVGLLVADVVTYASLRSYLYSQVDTELHDDAIPIGTQVADVFSRPFRAGVARVFPPPGLWVELRDQSGNVLNPPEAYPLSPPNLPLQLPGSGASSGGVVVFDAKSQGPSTVEYRVLAEPIQVGGTQLGTVIVAFPLNDLHHTLGRLLLVEILVTLGALGGLGALAWWIVERNLRPLDQMAATAGAIAAGDLSRRVDTTDASTEVAQLGQALNTMLSGIEGAFADRAASEERLRRFLADASHELRTPLTSIRGYAEMFDRGARLRPEDLAMSMRHIREEADRMSVLVDDLLLLARLDQQRPLAATERIDMAAVTESAVGAARVAAPARQITLAVTGAVPVSGDADRLRQVVDNLLVNALRHTPERTPIEVRLGTDDESACLEVVDHGPGVAPSEQAQIFEPFHRSDPTRSRATGGVGLGLTIASAITHAHGGTIGVVSGGPDDGAGATFWVRLPLAARTPDGQAAGEVPPALAGGDGDWADGGGDSDQPDRLGESGAEDRGENTAAEDTGESGSALNGVDDVAVSVRAGDATPAKVRATPNASEHHSATD